MKKEEVQSLLTMVSSLSYEDFWDLIQGLVGWWLSGNEPPQTPEDEASSKALITEILENPKIEVTEM